MTMTGTPSLIQKTRKLNNRITYQVGIIEGQSILRMSRAKENPILCVDIAIPSEATAEDITRLLAKTDPSQSLMSDDFISRVCLKKAKQTQIVPITSLFEAFCFSPERKQKKILKDLEKYEHKKKNKISESFFKTAKTRRSYLGGDFEEERWFVRLKEFICHT